MTDTSQRADQGPPSPASWRVVVPVIGIVIVAAGAITATTFMTEPTAQRERASKRTAMLVDVMEVQRGSYRPVVVATGTVSPERDIELRPRVNGAVVYRAPGLTPGGFVAKGDVLVRLDSADYHNALAQRRSDLRQAQTDLELERGRGDVARKGFELVEEELATDKQSLVLREPQLSAATERVEAAKAMVAQAELDLKRTTIRAPFDAHVLRRDVDVGSQVSPNDSLARLVGLDAYWVTATVPLAKLRLLSFPDEQGGGGTIAEIRHRAAWPDGATRTGSLHTLVGALEDKTRLARVIVRVEDPLARKPETGNDAPQLMIGSFVEVRMPGSELRDVVRLDRRYLRKQDTVWVMEDDTLRIREVRVAVLDADYAYIASGLDVGDRVVTTNLATVTDGAKLRLGGEPNPDEASQ